MEKIIIIGLGNSNGTEKLRREVRSFFQGQIKRAPLT
jgi:hypothetical protein